MGGGGGCQVAVAVISPALSSLISRKRNQCVVYCVLYALGTDPLSEQAFPPPGVCPLRELLEGWANSFLSAFLP